MRPSALPAPAAGPAPSLAAERVRLADGRATTLHLAAFPLAGVRVRVVRVGARETLARWCRRTATPHAIVGGFFVRGPNTPLGELRIGGRPRGGEPFAEPWHAVRGCVHAHPDGTRSSASLVVGGRLINRPREQHGIELLDGRPVSTALVLAPTA